MIAQDKPVTHRSYSQVRQLRTCGEQYRLERVEHAPSRPSAAAEGGKAIHLGTEDYDKGGTVGYAIDSAQFALAQSEVALEEQGWPSDSWKRYGKQDFAWYMETGIPQAITAYADWRVENSDFSLAEVPNFGPAIEVPFNLYIGGQLIHGWIDRIFTHSEQGGYYPLDLKSGRKPETDEQLGLYGVSLREGLGWEVNYGYYLYGLKSGKATLSKPQNLRHWDKAKLDRIYKPANTAIELGLFLPNPGDACFHCGVSDSCEFLQAMT